MRLLSDRADADIGEIDVTITATRRPQLLADTVRSFDEGLFCRARVRCLFLNIDPLWGSKEDGEALELFALHYFARGYNSKVVVRKPEEASFGAAVKWLWAQPETEWFLHLEDDWLLRQRLHMATLSRYARDPDLAGVLLKNVRNVILRKARHAPSYTTGPQFMRTRFAHEMAALLDPELDPEKQGSDGRNPALTGYVKTRRFRYWGDRLTPLLVEDTGREWRAQRGIEKHVVDGRSEWTGA